jgi:hypothetical protein
MGESIVYFAQRLTMETQAHSELFAFVHRVLYTHTSLNVTMREIYDSSGQKRKLVRGVPNPMITMGLQVRVTTQFDFHKHLPTR